ncbi:ABC transporter permease [Olivibacter ginsenosidimutans]|uniref:ABC transporter permease n=2 Tax=Olivibacter ginsenosidimutans TaxID=1176537 RepID=A0ABP9C1W9_9SPHI
MIVYYEFSYDQFEPKKDNTYRIVIKTKSNGGFEGYSGAVPSPLGNAIRDEIPGVEQAISIFSFPGNGQIDVSVVDPKGRKDILFKKQENVYFVDRNYTHLLDYQWLAGDPTSALEQPFRVVLTRSMATMYFPHQKSAEIIGRKLRYDDMDVTVTGIIQDLDKPTDFQGKAFLSIQTANTASLKEELMMDNWNDWMAYSKLFVTLAANANPEQVGKEINRLYSKHRKNEGYFSSIEFFLVPLADMHFDFRTQSVDSRIVNKSTLYGLIAIATFLLLLGCINYINLTTAQASKRAKEVGIRKTIGSSQKQLILQFLGETFFLTFLSILLSIILIPMLLQLFSAFIPEGLHSSFLFQPRLGLYLLVLSLLLTTAAGLYPAFVLSRYKPTQVIKNETSITFGQSRQAIVRKTLTVFQFIIAQFFIISTLMISKQLYFVLHADMGFQKEAIFTFDIPRDSVQTLRAQLVQRIQAIPGIALVSNGFASPAMSGGAFADLSYHNGKEEIKPQAQIRWGDQNYFKLYEIPLITGRIATTSDSVTELVANERFCEELGFKHAREAIGQFITYNGKMIPIVGVMKNFHAQNLHAEISPIVFVNQPGSTFHIKLLPQPAGTNLWQKTIAQIETIFRDNFPEEDFAYHFVDDSIAKFYAEEQRTALLLRWATGLTMFISFLGLLGLVLYTTNSRIREVGIRKVLGASVSQIIHLLSKDFVRLIILAFLIASPIAWWAVHVWLDNFAYKTSISWWIFALSGIGMLILAATLLSVQTFKAARANPVDSLRDE